jgi:hypothetical protein
MTTDVIEIKDGDIFRWRFKDNARNDKYLSYWCKSCIAIARNGWLSDTYWSSGSDCISWSYEQASEELTLTCLGNLSDLEQKPEYVAEYYDDADCVNINHANSSKGNFFIRKGAKRSSKKMREVIAYKIEKEESGIRVAHMHIECLRKEIAKLDAGDVSLEQIYVS